MTLIDFLNASPVNYLAVATLEEQLQAAGYRRLDPTEPFPDVRAGDKLYVTKNDSSLYAFHLGTPRSIWMARNRASASPRVAIGSPPP